ncbi:hypothetical protein ABZ863_08210 [Saccharomonospora sp. NPDC046836]|uniref:hypothetical protein n=1 Tax=Saccharomonospora sp. NPDC046836 TaxID=3156921 RepID=UPI0033E2EFA4
MTVTAAACSSTEPGNAAAEPTSSAAATTAADATDTSATSSADTSSADTGPAGDAGLTPPGTTLKVGERAVVPFEGYSASGTVAITVTAVEQGDQAAFDAQYGERGAGVVPYYIRYTLENVDGADLADTLPPRLSAITSEGRTTGVVLTGDLPDCENSRTPEDFTTPGASYEVCQLQGGREGADISGARFNEDDYRSDPVVWTS